AIPIMQDAPEAARAAMFEKIRTMIREDQLDLKVANARLLHLMFRIAFDPDVVSAMRRMRFTVWDVPSGCRLITSDQPVALFQPQFGHQIAPAGLLDLNTELTLP